MALTRKQIGPIPQKVSTVLTREDTRSCMAYYVILISYTASCAHTHITYQLLSISQALIAWQTDNVQRRSCTPSYSTATQLTLLSTSL